MQRTSPPLDMAKSFQVVYPPLSAAPTHKRHNLDRVLDSCTTFHVSFKSTNQCPAYSSTYSFNILNSNQNLQPTSSMSCCLHSRCLHFPNTQESLSTPNFFFWDPSCFQTVNNGSKISSTKFQKETRLKFWIVNDSEQRKKSQGILLCLSQAVNHPFSQKVQLVYITRPMVTQLPCVLPEYLPWYCCACPLSNP